MFLKGRGRGAFLILIILLSFINPTNSIAKEVSENSEPKINPIGNFFKKINFLSNPISDPRTLINGLDADPNLLIEAFKGPRTASNSPGVPDTYKVPKDLSGEDFVGSLKEIGLFVVHLFVVAIKILRDLVLGLIGYLTK